MLNMTTWYTFPKKSDIHNAKIQANEIALLQDSMFTKDVL